MLARPTRRSQARAILAAGLALLVGPLLACGADRTAVQLVLSPDPVLNSLPEVLRQVRSVLVVIDAESGLAGVESAGALPGGGAAVDHDGDGALEAVFSASLPEAGSDAAALPVLEIGLARNAGRELSFQALGFAPAASTAALAPDPSSAIALGATRAFCPADTVLKLGVPFNLRAAARPPQVILVLPADGATQVIPALSSVAVVFSTTVDATSATNRARLIGPTGAIVPTTATVETLTYASAGGAPPEQRSLLTLRVTTLPLANGEYGVELDAGVVSTNGHTFDQDPTTTVEEGFTSRFTVEATVGGPRGPCETCPPGYGCDEAGLGCEPLLDCASGCLKGFVCDAIAGQCAEDCRSYQSCPATGSRCVPETGLCAAIAGGS